MLAPAAVSPRPCPPLVDRVPSRSEAPRVVGRRRSGEGDGRSGSSGPVPAELADDLGIDLPRRARAREGHGQGRRGRRAPGRPAAAARLPSSAWPRRCCWSASATPASPTSPAGAALARRTRGARRVVLGRRLAADAARCARSSRAARSARTPSRAQATDPTPARGSVRARLTRPADAEAALCGAAVAAAGASTSRATWRTRRRTRSPRLAGRPGRDAASGRGSTSPCATRSARGRGLRRPARRRRRLGAPAAPHRAELRARAARRAATPHVVLVGKGITFDTGGLSLKPSDA